jgi:hypothetical protein
MLLPPFVFILSSFLFRLSLSFPHLSSLSSNLRQIPAPAALSSVLPCFPPPHITTIMSFLTHRHRRIITFTTLNTIRALTIVTLLLGTASELVTLITNLRLRAVDRSEGVGNEIAYYSGTDIPLGDGGVVGFAMAHILSSRCFRLRFEEDRQLKRPPCLQCFSSSQPPPRKHPSLRHYISPFSNSGSWHSSRMGRKVGLPRWASSCSCLVRSDWGASKCRRGRGVATEGAGKLIVSFLYLQYIRICTSRSLAALCCRYCQRTPRTSNLAPSFQAQTSLTHRQPGNHTRLPSQLPPKLLRHHRHRRGRGHSPYAQRSPRHLRPPVTRHRSITFHRRHRRLHRRASRPRSLRRSLVLSTILHRRKI